MQQKYSSTGASHANALLLVVLPALLTTASAETIFASGMEEFMWLEGRAGIDVPLSFAEVVQHTGTELTTARADAKGRFRIRVPRDVDAPVVLRANGVGAQSHIAFSSMPI
jgi:hypothetical protein